METQRGSERVTVQPSTLLGYVSRVTSDGVTVYPLTHAVGDPAVATGVPHGRRPNTLPTTGGVPYR